MGICKRRDWPLGSLGMLPKSALLAKAGCPSPRTPVKLPGRGTRLETLEKAAI